MGLNSLVGGSLGHYLRNNGTKYVDSAILNGDLPLDLFIHTITNGYGNDPAGTTQGDLVKLTTGGNAVNSAITDKGGIIGICSSGCSTTGSSYVSIIGTAACNFDTGVSTTGGDYVINSPTVAGQCHDAGATYPVGTQVIGRVLLSGSETIDLFPAEIQGRSYPLTVYSTPSGSFHQSIPIVGTSIAMVSPTATDESYRLTWYVHVTAPGASCGAPTTLQFTVYYEDPSGPSAVTLSTSAVTLAATNGSAGPASGWAFSSQQMLNFRNKAGYGVGYSTNYSLGTSCSPGPSYEVIPVLEQMAAN